MWLWLDLRILWIVQRIPVSESSWVQLFDYQDMIRLPSLHSSQVRQSALAGGVQHGGSPESNMVARCAAEKQTGIRNGLTQVGQVGRRKFRSQSSDYMDIDGKAEVGRVREEKRREEEIRSEKSKSQKTEDAGARQGRKVAIHCVFPVIRGSGESKSRLAKAAGLVRREMRNCTPLWREAHFQVYGIGQLDSEEAAAWRTIFGSQKLQDGSITFQKPPVTKPKFVQSYIRSVVMDRYSVVLRIAGSQPASHKITGVSRLQ